MRRVPLHRAVSEGAILAHDVIGTTGEVIVRPGYPLNQRTADALGERGVSWCFVEDAASAGVALVPLDAASGAVRAILRGVWARVAEAAAPFASLPTPRAIEAIRRAQPTVAVGASAPFTVLPMAVAEIVSHANAVDPRGGYVTAIQSAGDDDGHAIGAAALTARIAALIGLDGADVVEATTAALLRDIGLVLIPAAIRRAPPSKWTPPERRRYEDHTLLGAALLEPLGEPSLHFAIVAAEHHEAQDGSGYPGHLTGGNRVLRAADDRRDPQRIALLSEVVAVADRYERLLAPAPGYAGRSAAVARVILESEAGTVLNREIVSRFLATFPALPLGTEVRLEDPTHNGSLHGAYAVVCSVPRNEGGRPRVRLCADPEGRPVAPVEVDLVRERTLQLVPVDDDVERAAPAGVTR